MSNLVIFFDKSNLGLNSEEYYNEKGCTTNNYLLLGRLHVILCLYSIKSNNCIFFLSKNLECIGFCLSFSSSVYQTHIVLTVHANVVFPYLCQTLKRARHTVYLQCVPRQHIHVVMQR